MGLLHVQLTAVGIDHAATETAPHAEVVATLPVPAPSPAQPRPHATLPEQAGLRAGQVYLGWRLLSADSPPGTVTLRWDSTDGPDLPGCGSRPVAVVVRETPTAIRIGVIGPIPPDQPLCSDIGLVAIVDVHLSRPAGHRTVYRLTT
jgi:hypothetical protein